MRARARVRGLIGGALAALLGLAPGLPSAEAVTSVTLQPTLNDSYLDEATPNTNTGAPSEMRIRSLNGSRRRALVRFDVSTVPTDAGVKTATLSLFISTAFGSSRTLGAHRITGSVLWDATYVTWVNRTTSPSAVAWTTAGGDFNSTATSTVTTGTSSGVWKDWAIVADVQVWVNGSVVNNGMLIKDASEGGTDVFGRFASNN